MTDTDELLDLIQQVADAGGPLQFFADSEGTDHLAWDDHGNRVERINSVEVAWLDEPDAATFDTLAGVLRRDLLSRGLRVMTDANAGYYTVDVLVPDVPSDEALLASTRAYPDPLIAMLHAWLDAIAKFQPQEATDADGA